MTKKHYIAIARILAELYNKRRVHPILNVADALGQYFAAENPTFDYERFMRACATQDENARTEDTSK